MPGITIKPYQGQPIQVSSYDLNALIETVRETIASVDYQLPHIFTPVLMGVIKAYLRGRGHRVGTWVTAALAKELAILAINPQRWTNRWTPSWWENKWKGLRDDMPEQNLSSNNRLNFKNLSFTGGAPRPAYEIGTFGTLIAMETGGFPGPFTLTTRAAGTVFQDTAELIQFITMLWETADHIERTYHVRQENLVPSSYAYRAISEIELALRESHNLPEPDTG